MTTAVAETKVRRSKQERLFEAVNGRPEVGVKGQPGFKAAKSGLVPVALTAIQNVESITKFEPTQKQRAQILAALQSQLEQLTEAFSDTTEAPVTGFTLQA